jgi:hypothetical protein
VSSRMTDRKVQATVFGKMERRERGDEEERRV